MKFSWILALLFATNACAEIGTFYIKIDERFHELRRVITPTDDLVGLGNPSFRPLPLLNLENGEVSFKVNGQAQYFGKKTGKDFSFAPKESMTPFKVELNGESGKVLNIAVQTCRHKWFPVREIENTYVFSEGNCAPKEVYFLDPQIVRDGYRDPNEPEPQ